MDATDPITCEKKLQWLRSQIIGGAAEFRSPFGRRRITYADTTASGQSLFYIESYILHHLLPFYGNTHSNESYVGKRTTRMVEEATRYIKRCLGGGEDDAVLFCGSGATAAIKRLQEVMGIAVPATLKERVVLKEGERWVVFVGPYEHHSNLLSWRRSLAEVVEIGLNADGEVDVEALEAQLRRYRDANRPMMGSFSACSNVTGICCDTRGVATLLHQYGAFACFDFAASGAHVEMNMKSGEMDGYDAIFLSPHKFLGGPGSPGILLMNKALYLINSACPSTCGGGVIAYVNGFSEEDTLYYEDVEERENAGTPPITQIIRASLAFWMKEYIGPSKIEDREQGYIQMALERFSKNENIEILGNTRLPRQAILSFLVYPNKRYLKENTDSQARDQEMKKTKPLHGSFVAKLLNDLFGIQSREGCACAGPYGHSLLKVDMQYSLAIRSHIQKGYNGVKPGWTRISFPFYLSKRDFELILDGVEFVANYGQRFLPLYHFDWKTGSWTFKSDTWVSEVLNIFFKYYKHVEDNNTEKKCNTGKISPIMIDEISDSLKEIDMKGSEITMGTVDDKIMTCETRDETSGEVIQSRELYMEKAMYIAALLPKFPEQRKVPKDLDLDLFFVV
ncbi:hypothetical protein V2J09_016513 [Rumex salicifolius]